MNNTAKIVLVDDHVLLRNGLAALVTSLGYTILYECSNGRQLIEKLNKNNEPDLILMDINMPELDGFETTLWLKKNYPLINVLALSMYDNESSIIRMIKNGAKGYILKDTDPSELKQAISSVISKGFYYSDLVSGRLVRCIRDDEDDEHDNNKAMLGLNEKEIEFLKLAATEMTYKEIAQQMHLSPRTIDGYRDQLFQKLNVVSRVGLVLFAVKHGIVHCN
ncbi:response regulator transcription factor [Ilyomonas limi]|nr:response regulator transcription factor [Ilyomonas limi]